MAAKIFYLLSSARSGHHAIMNWICRQSAPSLYFENCLPALSVGRHHRFFRYGEDEEVKEIEKDCTLENVNELSKQFNLIILGFINTRFKDIIQIPTPEKFEIVIVVRDPYNWVGSRYNFGGGVRSKIRMRIGNWKHLVNLCIHKKELSRLTGINIIDINYNKWFLSKEYRGRKAEELEIDFTDKGLNDTGHMGKSSFEKKAIGQDLDIFNRWNKDTALYVDDEMKELSISYFDYVPIKG